MFEEKSRAHWTEEDWDEYYIQHARNTFIKPPDLKPDDPLEAMLGVQMIAAHRAAMNLYARAERAVASEMSLEEWNHTLNHAGKLTRTYIMGMDALNKHRGKGQQKVTVEHVHVHQGGQAVVGVVNGGGGRGQTELEEQSHAKQLTNVSGQAVWSENETWDALPVAGDAKRSVPDARRNKSRRTKG